MHTSLPSSTTQPVASEIPLDSSSSPSQSAPIVNFKFDDLFDSNNLFVQHPNGGDLSRINQMSELPLELGYSDTYSLSSYEDTLALPDLLHFSESDSTYLDDSPLSSNIPTPADSFMTRDVTLHTDIVWADGDAIVEQIVEELYKPSDSHSTTSSESLAFSPAHDLLGLEHHDADTEKDAEIVPSASHSDERYEHQAGPSCGINADHSPSPAPRAGCSFRKRKFSQLEEVCSGVGEPEDSSPDKHDGGDASDEDDEWRPKTKRRRALPAKKSLSRTPKKDQKKLSSDKSRFYCDVRGCQSSFGRLADMKRHKETVHGQKSQGNDEMRRTCLGCLITLSRVDALKRHESTCRLFADYYSGQPKEP